MLYLYSLLELCFGRHFAKFVIINDDHADMHTNYYVIINMVVAGDECIAFNLDKLDFTDTVIIINYIIM